MIYTNKTIQKKEQPPIPNISFLSKTNSSSLGLNKNTNTNNNTPTISETFRSNMITRVHPPARCLNCL